MASSNGLTTCRAAWMYCKKQRFGQRRRRWAFGWMWCGSRRKTHGCDRNVTMSAGARAGSGRRDPAVVTGGPSWL